MRLKMVVGELKELRKLCQAKKPRNGFHYFMQNVQWRVDDDSGEIELGDEDFTKIRLYSRTGYKKKLLAVFGRSLGNDFDANHTGWH